MNLELDLLNGFHAGPLFVPKIKRPSKKQLYKTGYARRKAEMRAKPGWADDRAIRAIYNEQRRLAKRDGPRTWAVDHEVPLNHPLVCGLHVEKNLKIIPYIENQIKSNNFWPDMPEQQISFLD